jgi:hypothetical protein
VVVTSRRLEPHEKVAVHRTGAVHGRSNQNSHCPRLKTQQVQASRDSSVGTVTRLQDGQPRNSGSIPGGGKRLSSTLKRLGRKDDPLTANSADVKSGAIRPSPYAFMVCKERTLLFYNQR